MSRGRDLAIKLNHIASALILWLTRARMQRYATITVIGRDKTGVIARVTNFLFEQKANIEALEERILAELECGGGQWELCDKSPAEAIYAALGVSKKAFKQATGALYRKRRIVIGEDEIRLVGSRPEEWRPE